MCAFVISEIMSLFHNTLLLFFSYKVFHYTWSLDEFIPTPGMDIYIIITNNVTRLIGTNASLYFGGEHFMK